jgi:hypothetical protein
MRAQGAIHLYPGRRCRRTIARASQHRDQHASYFAIVLDNKYVGWSVRDGGLLHHDDIL